MLDIGWWELAVIGMIALIVVGPAELPGLLRTIGRYVGMAKRQADEFRSQFDQAIRESEFNDLRKEFNDIKSGVTSSFDDAQNSMMKDDFDWDKDGPVKPPLEPADEQPTTSSAMGDGDVVTKPGSGASGMNGAKHEGVSKSDVASKSDSAPAITPAATEPPKLDTQAADLSESNASDATPGSGADTTTSFPARGSDAVR